MRTLFILLLALSAPLAWSASDRSVSVHAEAYVEAVPDTLELQVSIKKTAKSLVTAQQAVAHIATQVLASAAELGVADNDVDSSQVSTYPEYEWRKQERIYKGETAVRNITIKLRAIDRYGELIAKLSTLALQRMHGPSLSHSNIDELKLDALKKAITKGQHKAEVIAKQLSVRLGKIISVSEGGAVDPSPRMYAKAAMAMSDKNSNQSFSYAKQRISASVGLRFELN